MKKKINKILKNTIRCGIIAILPIVFNIGISNAYSSIENEMSNLIKKYDNQDIIFENGISIDINETLDLSKNSGWEMSNNNTVKIDDNGIVTPLNEGTVFLSNRIDGKVHIMELYVSNKNVSTRTLLENRNTNRDYYKVFIDAGHGGSDPGNITNGYEEKVLNLQIAKLVEKKLIEKNLNIEVMMSRTTDTFISLSKRAEMANEYEADVFISIHNNSYSGVTANGIETFYPNNRSDGKPLATEIQNNAIKETNATNRGVKSANFAVLRLTTMPASLFEGGFMSNEEELAKLITPIYQDKLATSIANGIEKYLLDNIKLTSEITELLPTLNIGEVVNTDSLNIRNGYGVTYSIIGTLLKGDKVEIVDSNNGWYKIKYNGNYGYISGSYIKIHNNTVNNNVSDNNTKNGWEKQNGKWYYYQNGSVYKGWLYSNGRWYLLDTSGEMITGWKLVDGKWYLLDTSGAMITGWKLVDGKWYLLDTSGVMLTGWKFVGGQWYYLYSSGVMATNTVVDGWEIDSSGVATQVK